MIFIRKFFDAAVTEPATQQPMSVAEAMAKHGVKSEPGSNIAVPTVNIPEKKEEPTAPEPAPVATTNDGLQNAEPANPEPPKPVEEPAEVPQPQVAAEPPKVPTWQEVLKSQQPDSIFKELGFDDNMVKLVNQLKEYDPKVVGLIQAYKEGNHVEYLREMSTDYSKLSSEDVMRHQLRREYPKVSDRQLEILYKKEVTEKYNLNSTDPDEAEEGKLLLDAVADRHRDTLIQGQEKYLLPKAPEPKAPEVDNSAEEAKQKFEAYRSSFTDNPYTKNILASKVFTIGEGEERFTYPIKEPDALVNVLYDGQQWMAETSKLAADGKTLVPDAEKQILIALVAKHGTEFLNEYAKHFKSLGGKTVVQDLENPKPPEATTTSTNDAPPKTAAEAMARSGRMNYGGYQ